MGHTHAPDIGTGPLSRWLAHRPIGPCAGCVDGPISESVGTVRYRPSRPIGPMVHRRRSPGTRYRSIRSMGQYRSIDAFGRVLKQPWAMWSMVGPSTPYLIENPISGGTCGMRFEPISVFEPAMEYTTFGWSRAIAIEKFDIGLLGLCGPSDISAVAYWSDIGLAHGPMVHMGHLTLPEPISKVACMVDIEQVSV